MNKNTETTDTERLDWLLKECGFTHYETKRKRVEFQWETNNFQISFREAIDAAMHQNLSANCQPER